MPEPWFSVAMGTLLGAFYGACGLLALRRAAYTDRQKRFLHVFLGGMVVRFALALVLLVTALRFAPVRGGVFAVAFMAAALAGIFGEVAYALRLLDRQLSR